MRRFVSSALLFLLLTAAPASAAVPRGGGMVEAERAHQAAYQQLMAKLPPAQRARLAAAEQAWLAYRQAHRNSLMAVASAPRMAEAALEAALVRTLADRTARLQAHHGRTALAPSADAVISAGGGRLKATQDAWSAYVEAEEAFHALYYGLRGGQDPPHGR